MTLIDSTEIKGLIDDYNFQTKKNYYYKMANKKLNENIYVGFY